MGATALNVTDVCVATHGELDSTLNDSPAGAPGTGDDVVDAAGDVTVGPNKICETTAIGADVSPPNLITAQDLEDYLNEQVWQPQANVHFEVTRNDATLHFDMGTVDRILGDYRGDPGDPTATPPKPPTPADPDELRAIDAAANGGVDIDGYIVDRVAYPIALAVRDPANGIHAFMSQDDNPAPGTTAMQTIYAHELGHLLGPDNRGHADASDDYLMHTDISGLGGEQFDRVYWRHVNQP